MIRFEVGDKVVCVDDRFPAKGDKGAGLTKGRIYTVRWIGKVPILQGIQQGVLGQIGIRLDEISRQKVFGVEITYRATRFRPLIKTDISIFKAMIEPVKGKELEEA